MDNMDNITVDKAIESSRMGYDVIFDSDNHKMIIGTRCNRCGNYFISNGYEWYCDECKKIRINILKGGGIV